MSFHQNSSAAFSEDFPAAYSLAAWLFLRRPGPSVCGHSLSNFCIRSQRATRTSGFAVADNSVDPPGFGRSCLDVVRTCSRAGLNFLSFLRVRVPRELNRPSYPPQSSLYWIGGFIANLDSLPTCWNTARHRASLVVKQYIVPQNSGAASFSEVSTCILGLPEGFDAATEVSPVFSTILLSFSSCVGLLPRDSATCWEVSGFACSESLYLIRTTARTSGSALLKIPLTLPQESQHSHRRHSSSFSTPFEVDP
ncbi:hypothetical protein R3P38DRAFT_2784708 [Favolaschia claudopus]|uniref:Uncharacterized protein n=1 Tax=Favolaschia claudopus TaxID=2862362 RepID=A0AAW0AWA1_9AGAR